MKPRASGFLLCLLLAACGKEAPTPTEEDANSAAPPWAGPETPSRGVPGDMVPPLEALGRVIFTDKGMADAFELAVGWPMPQYMKPIRGSCSVFPADNPGERNKSSQAVYYQVPPEMAIALADEIEKGWRQKYGDDPEMTIGRGVVGETYTANNTTFNKGAVTLGLYETYAAYRTISHQMVVDPVTGQVYLASRRGPVYPTPERPNPEKERQEAERERRAREKAERE